MFLSFIKSSSLGEWTILNFAHCLDFLYGNRLSSTSIETIHVLINLLFDTTPQSQTDQKSVVAAYDRRGEHIFTGNERGRIMVFRDSDIELTASFRLSSSLTAVKSIEFARRGRYVCAEITQGKMASL